MSEFYSEVKSFMMELGFTEKDYEEFVEAKTTDYVQFLYEKGAGQLMYRQNLRAIPEIGHRGLILPGGNVIIITKLPDGAKAILVQKRDNGEIGFSGGAIEEWGYYKTAIESPLLTAYREFFEEVGIQLEYELEFYTQTTSTIIYPNEDKAYGLSLFYRVNLPYELVEKFAEGGSEEGKMLLIKIEDIDKYKLFDNHKPVFEKLKSEI